MYEENLLFTFHYLKIILDVQTVFVSKSVNIIAEVGKLSLYSTAAQNTWHQGVGVGQCPRCKNFALEIPPCLYILALPDAKICVTPDAKPKICVTSDFNPRCQSVEYRWRLVPTARGWLWLCTFHVFLC